MTTPVVVEAAINGATSRAANPHVPRSPEEIVRDAIACFEAGAAIVHNHHDDGLTTRDGRHDPQPYRETWKAVLDARPDALWYPTMAGGGAGIEAATRYAHIEALAEDGLLSIGLVDPGSLSLGVLDGADLPADLDLVYVNSFRDARYMFEACARLQLAPSISIFEPGFLRVALAYEAAGAMPRGAWIKLYFGGPRLPFGLPPTPASLDAYLDMMRDSALPWSVAVLGGDVIGCGLAELALARGGHLRVGLEDYAANDRPDNAELMERARRCVAASGRSLASPSQAAALFCVPAGRAA